MKFLRDIARIWSMFVERMLYILDPHKVNDEIEYLRMQIQVERNEKLNIIEQLTARGSQQIIDTESESVRHEPINPYIPWRIKRAQLEAEHRIKSDPAGIAAGSNTKSERSKVQQDIANLEEELEISHAD